ncbi:MAG: sigma-70 family RNA polymerase sigma factor [Myxococcales bacterium]|nr:sigma-70 family RNA polymerase sigma factor [Myxococcales bacterium]
MVSLAAPTLLQELVLTTVDPDRELADRFQQGDRAAFDQLVKRHQKGVYRIVRRYVRSDADAADVSQQAFVRAFKGLMAFRGAASVRSWLYRIGINCALSWLRDHRREQPAEIAEDALTEDHASPGRLLDGERSVRLRDAIAKLPPKQKLVLELRVFDDLAFKEVAELAECSENTAKVNFHYAVKRLRELLGDEA